MRLKPVTPPTARTRQATGPPRGRSRRREDPPAGDIAAERAADLIRTGLEIVANPPDCGADLCFRLPGGALLEFWAACDYGPAYWQVYA